MYQYARIKKTEIMVMKNPDANFKEIYVVPSIDQSLRFIFMVKTAQYQN